jgi:hypothetical protein
MAGIYRMGRIWWIKHHLNGVRVQQSLHTSDVRVARARKSQTEYRVVTGGFPALSGGTYGSVGSAPTFDPSWSANGGE